MKQKFRAWDSAKKEMFKDTFAITESGQVVVVEQEDVMSPPDYVFVDHLVIMQSTGLFDKTNTEIFEGDIVKMSKDVSVDTTYYEVVRRRGGAYSLESKQHGCDLWIRHTDCEIIGNIYENKDILEDKE